jgi:hypothetical protein
MARFMHLLCRGRMRNRRDVRKGILTQEYYYCRSWFPD